MNKNTISPKKERKRSIRPVTARQQAVLDYLHNYFKSNGFWPSIREILENFGFKSTNAVQRHLHALERKGCISRAKGQARAYRLAAPASGGVSQNHATSTPFPTEIPEGTLPVVNIPLYGSIAAGYPDRVESAGVIGRLQIDVQTAGLGRRGVATKAFALRVRGESMIDAGIFDGDIVIVEPSEGTNGDIVAALIDGETTLKRLIVENNQPPYLKAENRNYPQLYPLNELVIQGVARSVVRSL